MGYASLATPLWIRNDPSDDRFKLWCGLWTAPNFNSTSITVQSRSELLDDGATRLVYVDGVLVKFDGANPGITYNALYFYQGNTGINTPWSSQYMVLEGWTTATAVDTLGYTNLNLPCMPPGPTPANWIYFSEISGYAAADDFVLNMWGRLLCLDDRDTAGPEPVSLEAYKWPMTRRY